MMQDFRENPTNTAHISFIILRMRDLLCCPGSMFSDEWRRMNAKFGNSVLAIGAPLSSDKQAGLRQQAVRNRNIGAYLIFKHLCGTLDIMKQNR